MKKIIFLVSLIFTSFLSNAQCVSTLAGSGTFGFLDSTGLSARFNSPTGVAVDGSGNVFIADKGNHRIRKISTTGIVSTLAGSGTNGFANGTGIAAQFSNPTGVVVDAIGNVYVSDSGNSKIRKITPSGVVTTLAGSGTYGFLNGSGTTAQFKGLEGIAVDVSGNVYVADSYNNQIRKISPTGVVSTFAGTVTAGYLDGASNIAKFNLPFDVAIDNSGNLYVADSANQKIRKISSSGDVSTLAGSTEGFANGIGTAAKFDYPYGVTVDAAGNVYVADLNNNKIRIISPVGEVNSLAGSAFGFANGLGDTAQFNWPNDVATNANGIIYVADRDNHRIRKITPYSVSVNINYTNSPFCKSLSSAQTVVLTGTGTYTGGTFNSTTGLSINSTTGTIIPSSSTPGTYTVSYTTQSSGGCQSTTTTQVTITALPTASISYSGNPFCRSISTARTITLTGTGTYTGGTYSSSTGLTINSTTGAIIPSTSIPGTYTVTYITPASGGCSAVSTSTQVTITTPPSATISYSGSPYCQSLTTPQQVTLNGTGNYTGGYFSFPNNAVDSSNGAINPSLSPPGTYTVTYTIPAIGGCSAVSTSTQVTILPTPIASISADGIIATSTTINTGSSVQLQLNGALNPQSNIQWTPATYISSTSVSNPIVYPYATTTYTANFTNSNGCPQTSSITINVNQNPIIGSLLVSSSQQTIGLFDTITVNIYVEPNDLYSLYMKLKGNIAVNQYLDYAGYTAGTILGTGSNVISTPPVVTNGVPEFGITKVGSVPGFSGNGLFYTFTYVPKNIPIPNGTEFCFYLDDVSAYNSLGTQCSLINYGQYCFWFTNQVSVWPGDLNKSNTVTTADLLPIGYFYNSTGPARTNTNIQWFAHPATLWGYNHSSQNGDGYKVFADSNGDGLINNADQAAIGFNMNQVHARMASPAASEAPPHFTVQQLTTAAGSLTVTPNNTIINGATLPQTITFTVNLNNTGGLSALYGISVNLVFDETIFDLTTATIDYMGSIFGNVSADCLALNYNSSNIVSVGLTRFGNDPINGQGLLFKVTIQTKGTLPNLAITSVTAYVDAANNQTGDTLVVQDSPANNLTIINNLGTNTIKQHEFILYPNPAKEQITIQLSPNNFIKQVDLVDMLGRLIITKQYPSSNTTEILSINDVGNGTYLLEITTDNNQKATKKILVN